MFLEWIISFWLGLFELLTQPFEDLPDLVIEFSGSLDALVPYLTSAEVGVVNAWINTSIIVVIALAVGRALQWVYKLIPGKMT